MILDLLAGSNVVLVVNLILYRFSDSSVGKHDE
jgi:hypothetical protein